MKLFSGAKIIIILLLVTFIECCLFFGADCDLKFDGREVGNKQLINGATQLNEISSAPSRIKSDKIPSAIEQESDASIEHNILKSDNRIRSDNVQNRANLHDAELAGQLESDKNDSGSKPIKRILIVKRSAQAASRRKQPKVHLAQRPKGSSSTTTSTTTTTTTSSSINSADTAENEEESEYEEVEEESPTVSNDGNKVSEISQVKKEQPTTSTSTVAPTTNSAKLKSKEIKQKGNTVEPKSRSSSMRTNSSIETTAAAAADAARSTSVDAKKNKKPLMALPFLIKPKNSSVCTPEAFLEFPRDLIGNKWRGRGLILIHIVVVCYMFYSLALICERYFMPSLEEFAQRLQLSEDVAGATLMSAGSSAPELFTAILGVFIAKGDIGTGTIVGSAVFNILFVIGVCAFVSTTTAQLNWWPVLRDSVFYSFTVLVLILFIYDERITAYESFAMLALYGVYILIMANNEAIKAYVTRSLLAHPLTANLISSAIAEDGPDDVFGSMSAGGSSNPQSSTDKRSFFSGGRQASNRSYQTTSMIAHHSQKSVEEDSMFLAACLVIVQHKRLFRSQLRFQAAARYIIIKRQHRIQQQQKQKSATQSNEVNYFGPETEPLKSSQHDRMAAYAMSTSMSKNKFSIVSKDDYEFWNRPPEEGENYYLWLAKIPVNFVLHYTVPDCSLYPDKFLYTFFISILWTAVFSYVMVWMVTLIGYTLGIPDSVMGATFLAAGTSVPDCYSSIHAARNGMADMAVSNSIGSNVFDILVGLSLPWFIQTAIYPGVVATINSRGVIYSVVLLFLSLIVTIYLLNKYEWTLKPRLGLALLIAYGLFIILSCMLEFNLFGHVNPPSCPVE